MIENHIQNLNAYLHRAILYYENAKCVPRMVSPQPLDLHSKLHFCRYKEAIKDFQDVLALNKEFSPALVNLGIIYMNVDVSYWK
jgi:hypothetical protein